MPDLQQGRQIAAWTLSERGAKDGAPPFEDAGLDDPRVGRPLVHRSRLVRQVILQHVLA